MSDVRNPCQDKKDRGHESCQRLRKLCTVKTLYSLKRRRREAEVFLKCENCNKTGYFQFFDNL